MKFFFSIMLSCTLLSSPFYEEQPLIQPASADLSESSYQMSVAKGEVAELSARQLEIRLGLEEGELLGITITALPDNGSLVLDGARISEFSQLTREELDRLCFVPGENALRSGFSFIPNCPSRATATLSVHVADELPTPPQAQDMLLHTWSDIGIQTASLFDAETQTASVHITRSPQNGVVKTDGQSFTYQPFTGLAGEDQFSYVLMDAYGNLSAEATVSVTIQENKNNFSFADMIGRPETAAAITLHQNDILCGEKIGDDWYFHPDNTMTRGQFLICLLAAKNTPLTEQAVIQTNLSNDRELSLWIKPYLQTAIQQKIITESTFSPDEPISFSEAEELLRRTFDPSWKKSAFSSFFTAFGTSSEKMFPTVLDQTPLTRADCAVLLSEMTNNFPL